MGRRRRGSSTRCDGASRRRPSRMRIGILDGKPLDGRGGQEVLHEISVANEVASRSTALLNDRLREGLALDLDRLVTLKSCDVPVSRRDMIEDALAQHFLIQLL